MRFLGSIFLLLSGLAVQAQQWVDQPYSYDSTLNLVYGTAVNFNQGIDTLKMDVYWPICADSSRLTSHPLLVWIHGGAFLAGSKDDPGITRLCKSFARRGYVTASISYRLGFIADDLAWSCNYPNYGCVFAADSAEWHRALYRGIQDGKGALRYLVNRQEAFRIDTSNVFVAGESAGAFIALGTALLDTAIERMPQTYAIPDVPAPHPNALACVYNGTQNFPHPTISRPDLGEIDGDIEPTTIDFTIKGVGNMYGGMTSDWLRHHAGTHPKPAIYSFHQPCDLVVPIDSGRIYQGLSWCFTNGYNCYGVANTAKVFGSRAISHWNLNNNYGYTLQNEFTATSFPFNFLFGTGSCADQVGNPCHAYDHALLRENHLAAFFAGWVTTDPGCDTTSVSTRGATRDFEPALSLYPNPAHDQVTIRYTGPAAWRIRLTDLYGRELLSTPYLRQEACVLDLSACSEGMYLLSVVDEEGLRIRKPLVKR